jgi:hypothetical protein
MLLNNVNCPQHVHSVFAHSHDLKTPRITSARHVRMKSSKVCADTIKLKSSNLFDNVFYTDDGGEIWILVGSMDYQVSATQIQARNRSDSSIYINALHMKNRSRAVSEEGLANTNGFRESHINLVY